MNNMRSLLQTHQNSLNIALAMVQLHHRTHGPDYEHTDLRPEIYRLTRIVERLPTADDLQRLRDGLTADHVRELQRVAQRVVRDASQTAGSSAASELGAPLDPNTRRRIDEWIDRNAFEEHGTQVDLGQELGFNTASTRLQDNRRRLSDQRRSSKPHVEPQQAGSSTNSRRTPRARADRGREAAHGQPYPESSLESDSGSLKGGCSKCKSSPKDWQP